MFEPEINILNNYIFCIILSLSIFSCTNQEEHISNFVTIKNLPIEEIICAEVIYSENENIKVRVYSNLMKRFSEEDVIEFSDSVKFNFYKLEQHKPSTGSTLTCGNATINNENNIMIANESVVLRGSNNQYLFSEQLIWDQDKEIIYTDSAVTIILPEGDTIYASSFISDPEFSKYSFSKPHGSSATYVSEYK